MLAGPAVPLPEKGVIVRKSGQYKYVYKRLRSFRNERGVPDSKRILIGRLDDSGMLIPNHNYQQYYKFETQHTDLEVKGSIKSVKDIGASFLVHQLFRRLGVDNILNDVFQEGDGVISEMLLTIAVYMACRGNVIEYIRDWCEKCWISSDPIPPQKASHLFSMIDYDSKMRFFKQWIANYPTGEPLAYDVTSFSTYAKGMKDAEWGYNRDGDKLPQINLGCYLSYQNGMPLFYVTYPGSIVDKSHMPYMMQYNDELGIKDALFVLDRGFCTTKNLQWLHSEMKRYVMAVDTYHKTTREAIDSVRDVISSSVYRVREGIFSKTIASRFYGVRSEMHVYYSKHNADQQWEDLYRLALSRGETLAQMEKITPKEIKLYSRFYDINAKKDGSFTYFMNYDKFDKIAANCGYFCILSNTSLENSEILTIYRRKDIIEKAFDEIKNSIDMKRLRTHNNETTSGKLFCAFLALIAISQLMEPLKEINAASGKRRLSKQGLFNELDKIRIVSFSSGFRMLTPLSKFQREIFTAFGFSEMDLKNYARIS